MQTSIITQVEKLLDGVSLLYESNNMSRYGESYGHSYHKLVVLGVTCLDHGRHMKLFETIVEMARARKARPCGSSVRVLMDTKSPHPARQVFITGGDFMNYAIEIRFVSTQQCKKFFEQPCLTPSFDKLRDIALSGYIGHRSIGEGYFGQLGDIVVATGGSTSSAEENYRLLVLDSELLHERRLQIRAFVIIRMWLDLYRNVNVFLLPPPPS